MEFTIECPNDGQLEVGLEDVENMVVRESGEAEIAFCCPKCGAHVVVIAPVPAFLIGAMEGISRELGIDMNEPGVVFSAVVNQVPGSRKPKEVGHAPAIAEELSDTDSAQVDYFRSQLDGISSVDQFLGQFE